MLKPSAKARAANTNKVRWKLPDAPTPAQLHILAVLATARSPKTNKDLACHYRTLLSLEDLDLIDLKRCAAAAWMHTDYRNDFNAFKVNAKGRAVLKHGWKKVQQRDRLWARDYGHGEVDNLL